MSCDIRFEFFNCISIFVSSFLLSCLLIDFIEGIALQIVVYYLTESMMHQ